MFCLTVCAAFAGAGPGASAVASAPACDGSAPATASPAQAPVAGGAAAQPMGAAAGAQGPTHDGWTPSWKPGASRVRRVQTLYVPLHTRGCRTGLAGQDTIRRHGLPPEPEPGLSQLREVRRGRQEQALRAHRVQRLAGLPLPGRQQAGPHLHAGRAGTAASARRRAAAVPVQHGCGQGPRCDTR